MQDEVFIKLVDDFNTASKLAMVAQAKLGEEQRKAAEGWEGLMAAQDEVARKEAEVAKMLSKIANLKLDVGRRNSAYMNQQLQVQKAATELYTADAVVQEKMVLMNSCLMGGPRSFVHDIREKQIIKRAGEAALQEARELRREQEKAEKEAAEKTLAAKVAAEVAAKAAQEAEKLRSQAAALTRESCGATVQAPGPNPATPPTSPARINTGTRPKVLVNKENKKRVENINLPAEINLVVVVEDQTPINHDQYR